MKYLIAVVLATLAFKIAAECPNACSAHGTCGAYDMCTCFRNWMSDDCSERICQFGLAHVDSPKGDLDASGGALSGPDVNVIVNSFLYPFGTTELYPSTTDIAGNVLENTAHEYRECSNKGICDRTTGTCSCFEGYEGSACQRASCPVGANGVCSGHGTCQTISEIAWQDSQNTYRLWDKDATLGCVCDAGYEGPDCSLRKCKVGTDPLYFDNNATLRYTNFTYHFYTVNGFYTVYGNYSLVFYDVYGEDWHTEPLSWNATCDDVIDALEGLPNNVIPTNSVRCYKSANTDIYGQDDLEPIPNNAMYIYSKYTIAFPKNPGKLKQIKIDKYLDGSRPTLYSSEATSSLNWKIYPNGFIGEEVDVVPDRCFGVTVTLGYTNGDTTHYLGDLTSAETKLLKTCLGDSNGDSADNVEVYNWDYGNAYNPHLIKLQEATEFLPTYEFDSNGDVLYDPNIQKIPVTTLCDKASVSNGHCSNSKAPGFYAVLFYDPSLVSTYPFRLYTRSARDYSTTTQFYVYTTTGYLQVVNYDAGAFTSYGGYTSPEEVASLYSNTVLLTNTTSNITGFYGDLSCLTTVVGVNGALDCLNKNDQVLLLNTQRTVAGLAANPVYPNIYTVEKIFTAESTAPNSDGDGLNYLRQEESNNLVLDYSMNAQYDLAVSGNQVTARVYKFYPPENNFGGLVHTGPCAGRGICNQQTGICECFNGYSKDDCTCINNLVF